MPKNRESLEDRFWRYVSPEPNSGCWLWAGGDNGRGYGTMKRPTPQPGRIYAHRFSFEMHKGPIPEGYQIDHLCRVRCCVNPDHLEAVTPQENLSRVDFKAAWAAQPKRLHCPSGHALSGDNVRIHKDGYRYCVTCARAAWRRHNLKRQRAGGPA